MPLWKRHKLVTNTFQHAIITGHTTRLVAKQWTSIWQRSILCKMSASLSMIMIFKTAFLTHDRIQPHQPRAILAGKHKHCFSETSHPHKVCFFVGVAGQGFIFSVVKFLWDRFSFVVVYSLWIHFLVTCLGGCCWSCEAMLFYCWHDLFLYISKRVHLIWNVWFNVHLE